MRKRAAGGVLYKKMFLEISQSARESFLKDSLAQVFSCDFENFYEHFFL